MYQYMLQHSECNNNKLLAEMKMTLTTAIEMAQGMRQRMPKRLLSKIVPQIPRVCTK